MLAIIKSCQTLREECVLCIYICQNLEPFMKEYFHQSQKKKKKIWRFLKPKVYIYVYIYMFTNA